MSSSSLLQVPAKKSLILIEPTGSIEEADDEREDEAVFTKLLDGLITKISATALSRLQSNELHSNGNRVFVEKTFLSKRCFKKLDADAQGLVRKIVFFVKMKAHSFHLSHSLETLEKRHFLCLPAETLPEVTTMTAMLKQFSPESWSRIVLDSDASSTRKHVLDPMATLKEHADLYDFASRFNRDFGEREENKRAALEILDSLRQVAWKNCGGVRIIPNIEKLSWTRKALYMLYQCHDSDIKERALRELVDLLESDPIHMKTAYDLVDMQKRLLREIQAHKAQNLNITLQRLLIKAYATTLECILLHAHSSHLNALEEKMKHSLWDSADSLNDFNINKDEEIALWTKYAVQGAQRIKTEVPEWKKWVPRLIAIGNAVIQIGMLIEKPEKAFSAIANIVSDFSEAFSHFEWHKEWFEELMALRRITRISLLSVPAFRKVTRLYQRKKNENTNAHVLYGAVSTLEHAVMNSPSRVIQEEAMKLLVQYLTLDNSTIKTRIVQAFTEMLEGPDPMRNTAYVVLRLLEDTSYIPSKEIWQEVRKSPHFVTLLKSDSVELQKSLAENHYPSVIKFVIRRIGNIKGERDCGGQSFTTLICSSKNSKMVAPLLKCLSELSPEFSKRDVYGNTPFHLGVREKNPTMICHASGAVAGDIDINAKDYCNSNTALHLAAKDGYKKGAQLLLSLGANPNIENADGASPLHLAVESGCKTITEMLLDNGAEKNNLNIFGKTALNIAIKTDNVYLTELLIQRGAKLAEHVNQITPIIYAARKGSERTLIHLLEKNPENLTRLEALEITKMISRDGETVCASDGFCRYHLEKLEKDPHYAGAFSPYNKLPRIDYDTTNQIAISNPRKYAIGSCSPFIAEKMSYDTFQKQKRRTLKAVDDFGNTELILLAKSANKIDAFKKLLAETRNINTANYLGLTALHVAVIYGNEEAVKTLLKEKKTALHARDIRGFSVLHLAAFMRNTRMIKLLLDNHADPNAVNDYGDTPFLVYCGNFPKRAPESLWSVCTKPELVIPPGDSVEALELLLENGASHDESDSLGNNALHHAACNGVDSIIAFLFEKFPELMWQRNKKGLLPVQEAVLLKRQHDLDILLKGASLSDLHKEFIAHTDNEYTLGNLLALTDQNDHIEKLFRENPSLAEHKDATPFRYTPLHAAAKRGRPNIVTVYQELGIDLMMRDAFGNTPAHVASLGKQTPFLEALIKSGADLSLKNHDGRNPLHLAAAKDGVESVKLLSAFPNLVREKDGNGDLPLHLACKFRREEAAGILCEAFPGGIHEVDDDLNTPLHHACYSGNAAIVKTLVEGGARLEAENIFGETPLSIAALNGHADVVAYLIQKGADISSQDIEKETPLHKAVYGQHLLNVNLLLEADNKLVRPPEKALVHISDVDSETALHELPKAECRSLHHVGYQEEILLALLRNHADITKRNDRGETFFHLVSFYGHEHLLLRCREFLRQHCKCFKFKVNDPDKKGNTLLHKAAEGNRIGIAKELISLKASLKRKNEAGETPLFTAVKYGHYELAAFLYEKGAALNTRNESKESILHAMLEKETIDEKTLGFLKWAVRKSPSLLYLRDDKKRTPLHIVAERNHLDAVDIILKNLPGDQKKKEKYLWKRTVEGLTAQQIAKNNGYDKLEVRLRTYPREELGVEKV